MCHVVTIMTMSFSKKQNSPSNFSLWFAFPLRLPKKKIDAQQSADDKPLLRKKSKVKKRVAKGTGARK